jgi:hypothetical protein
LQGFADGRGLLSALVYVWSLPGMRGVRGRLLLRCQQGATDQVIEFGEPGALATGGFSFSVLGSPFVIFHFANNEE